MRKTVYTVCDVEADENTAMRPVWARMVDVLKPLDSVSACMALAFVVYMDT
jgi:hypothetical protein